jgi:hypothetical protein
MHSATICNCRAASAAGPETPCTYDTHKRRGHDRRREAPPIHPSRQTTSTTSGYSARVRHCRRRSLLHRRHATASCQTQKQWRFMHSGYYPQLQSCKRYWTGDAMRCEAHKRRGHDGPPRGVAYPSRQTTPTTSGHSARVRHCRRPGLLHRRHATEPCQTQKQWRFMHSGYYPQL